MIKLSRHNVMLCPQLLLRVQSGREPPLLETTNKDFVAYVYDLVEEIVVPLVISSYRCVDCNVQKRELTLLHSFLSLSVGTCQTMS